MRTLRKVHLVEYLPGEETTPWAATAKTFTYPADDFIIFTSRDNLTTYFKNNVWQFNEPSTALKLRHELFIDRNNNPISEQEHLDIKQSKCILLAIMRHAYKSTNTPLSHTTINRFNILLASLRKYTKNQSIQLFEALSSSYHVEKIFNTHINNSASKTTDLCALLYKLSILPFRYVGFKPAQSRGEFRGDSPDKKYLQTAVIPTSIYLQIINNYREVSQDFLESAPRLKKLILNIYSNPEYGRAKIRNLTLPKCGSRLGLKEYFEKYRISILPDLARHLALVQYCNIMLIHVFSGMRASEAYSLRGNSLERVMIGGVSSRRRFLHGHTTKFKKAPTPTKWISSPDVDIPFESACKLAEIIYSSQNVHFNNQPIFISTAYLSFSGGRRPNARIDSPRPVWGNYTPYYFEEMLSTPLIKEEDVCELESVCPTRVWRAESEFAIGQPWPVRIHQLRRSTAVYAIRSGLVSLPALKAILHHVTLEMSLYYARGSSFATDLLKEAEGDKGAFVRVYQDAEQQVRSWQYTNEFLFSDEVLHGPHGIWLKGKNKNNSNKVSYAKVLDDTLKRMKRGELHYQPTPVGGCTSGEVCHKRISVNFLGCDGCKSAAIKPSKVLKLIEVQKVLVSHCDVDSPERNAENQTLFELTEFAQNMGISA